MISQAFKRRPKNGETLEEIEDFETAPAGTEEEVWIFVNQQRKEKLKIEEKVKIEEKKLTLMKNFLEQRQMEDDTSEKKLEKILDELNHHQMNIEKVYNPYFF